jgi:hypothetical protein
MDKQVQPGSCGEADALDGAVWHKSSHSGTQGNCVQVATNLPGIVAVRDSKDPDGGVLRVSRGSWRGFVKDLQGRTTG